MTISSLGSANRLVGYLAAFLTASLFYVVWFLVQSRTPGSNVSVDFEIGLALFFWFFEGAAAALALTAIPWYLALQWHDRAMRRGWVYFSVIGAVTILVLAGATSSLAPKPLFIEDQTFLQGFVIAIQREGLCFLLTGLLFGWTFWFVSERRRYSRS